MLNKIFDKNNKNLSFYCSFVKYMCFCVMTLTPEIHGMEEVFLNDKALKGSLIQAVPENPWNFVQINDTIPKILGEFYKVEHVCGEIAQKSYNIQNSITFVKISYILSLVCQGWREIILKMRINDNCNLFIPESKKLLTIEDYQAIQDSEYKIIYIYSESLDPQDVSYLNYLVKVTQLVLLPPKPDFDILNLNFEEGWDENMKPQKQWVRSDVIKNIHVLKEKLKVLSLESNNIQACDLVSVILLKNLIELDLRANHVTDDILLDLRNLKELRCLKCNFFEIEDVDTIKQKLKDFMPYCRIEEV